MTRGSIESARYVDTGTPGPFPWSEPLTMSSYRPITASADPFYFQIRNKIPTSHEESSQWGDLVRTSGAKDTRRDISRHLICVDWTA
jgi:hypothetical protein